MTNLSPQAQTIIDAYENTTDKYDALAAVLRVLADNVVPEDYDHWDGRDGEYWSGFEFGQNQRNEDIRLQVLKIVKELENV
jgi:hypothetical protein